MTNVMFLWEFGRLDWVCSWRKSKVLREKNTLWTTLPSGGVCVWRRMGGVSFRPPLAQPAQSPSGSHRNAMSYGHSPVSPCHLVKAHWLAWGPVEHSKTCILTSLDILWHTVWWYIFLVRLQDKFEMDHSWEWWGQDQPKSQKKKRVELTQEKEVAKKQRVIMHHMYIHWQQMLNNKYQVVN